jgi:hypothetical protein
MLISAGTVLILYVVHLLSRLYLGRILKLCRQSKPKEAFTIDTQHWVIQQLLVWEMVTSMNQQNRALLTIRYYQLQ